jgi:MoxR-like ATPase
MAGRMDEHTFATILGRVLSPSRAIESPELLKGRDDQLREIRRAWYQGGRQIFIYGFRGVGKTSLAQTAAFQHQSSDAPCRSGSSASRRLRSTE